MTRKSWRDEYEAALARDGDCQFPHVHTCSGPLQVHHMLPRGRGGSNELDNLVTLCAWSHAWVESNRTAAYEMGLLRRTPPVDRNVK